MTPIKKFFMLLRISKEFRFYKIIQLAFVCSKSTMTRNHKITWEICLKLTLNFKLVLVSVLLILNNFLIFLVFPLSILNKKCRLGIDQKIQMNIVNIWRLTLSLPIPDEERKAFIKPFEAPQRSVKIKI